MEKEKWKDSVLASLQGSSRAKPPADLLAKIEAQLDTPETKIIPMRQWRVAVAAAVVLLVLNVFALRQLNEQRSLLQHSPQVEESTESGLISNYKLYN